MTNCSLGTKEQSLIHGENMPDLTRSTRWICIVQAHWGQLSVWRHSFFCQMNRRYYLPFYLVYCLETHKMA